MSLFEGFHGNANVPQTEAASSRPDELDRDNGSVDASANAYRKMYLNMATAGDDVLLYYPERATPIVVPNFDFALLDGCSHFASIEAHAATIARSLDLSAALIARRLSDLVKRGLLVSHDEVLARARATALTDKTVPPVLDRIAVITADRPVRLAICLDSYRKRYGEEIELVVFDDSADAAMRTENRRVAARAGAGGRIFYAGGDEKRRLVTVLAAKSGIDPEIVGAAVGDFDGCGWHTGANRNAALLDAAGGAVLMVDDDSTSRAATPAGSRDGFRLSSRADPSSFRFFTRIEDALDAAEWGDSDILAWHRRFLGRSPAACAFAANTNPAAREAGARDFPVDLNEADTALIAAFGGGCGRVVTTVAGVVGDSGLGLQFYYLMLEGANREQLLQNYHSYRTTRSVHRGAENVTVTSTPFLMAGNSAFDVRDTIPPFSPVLRTEDSVFGNLLRTCAPDSYMAYLPRLVEHTPPLPRITDLTELWRSVSSVRANHMICNLALAHEPGHGITDPAARLRAFGQYLVSLAAMPPAEFDKLVQWQISSTIASRLELLTRAFSRENGEPEAWADDCAKAVADGLRTLSTDNLVISDLPGATSDEQYRRFQRLLYRFGRVIHAWPTLLEAAKGTRVAQPLQ